LRIATISAVCVGLDEFADGETICGFLRGNTNVVAHELVPSSIRSGVMAAVTQVSRGFRGTLDPVSAVFTPNA
jgi:hypothetical protein